MPVKTTKLPYNGIALVKLAFTGACPKEMQAAWRQQRKRPSRTWFPNENLIPLLCLETSRYSIPVVSMIHSKQKAVFVEYSLFLKEMRAKRNQLHLGIPERTIFEVVLHF